MTADQLSMLGGFVVFLSVPSAEADPWEIETIETAIEAVERVTGESLVLITGNDAEDQTPRALRAWIRNLFTHEVDGLIELHGSSFGCGHEDGLAAIQRLPRLLLFREGDSRSNAAGSDGASVLDEGAYQHPDELRELTISWLLEVIPRMRAQRHRHERGAETAGPTRQRVLKALEQSGDDFVQSVAGEMELTRRQLIELCYDDRRFASLSFGDVNYLLWVLESEPDPEPEPAEPVALSPRQQRAFLQARRTWDWDDETAAAVLQRGRARLAEAQGLELVGIPSRFSLETRMGWRAIHKELCDE